MNVFKAARLYSKLKPYLEILENKPLGTLLKNWKTTLGGIIGLIATAGSAMGWLTHDQAQSLGAVAISFGLLAAKDFNVTGTKIVIGAMLLFALPAHAQTPAPFLPAYYVGTGVTYNYYGGTGFAANTVFAAQANLLNSAMPKNLYSYSTLELTKTQAVLRSGAGYIFFNQGNWSMVALGDGGLATGSGPTLGSFSGGGFLNYDIGARLTKGAQHLYIGLGGRLITMSSLGVQPIPMITIGKGF